MNNKTRMLVLSALFSALAVISLFFASIWPSGQLGFAAVSSLFVAASVIESGVNYGIYVYVISAVIGMLLPDKAAPLLYTAFFGYYPVFKSLIERIKHAFFQWTLKLIVFNTALTLILCLIKVLTFDFSYILPALWVLYPFGNVVFILFDYGYTKIIRLYISSISRYINKRK